MTEFARLLSAAVSPHVSLTGDQVRALELHYELLSKWNRRLNLTAIRSIEDAVRRHYAECVWFAAQVRRFSSAVLGLADPRVADVGSGGGFPGVPLAIVTGWPVTLIESHQRKAVFLAEVARVIPNIAVYSGRAEDNPQRFDICVSRAVKPADVLKLTIAPAFALLMGEDDVPRGTPGTVCRDPWGQRRVALFHVEQSRE